MTEESLTIVAESVQKRFTGRPVFKPISFEASPSEIIGITGPNGAGKSTLIKIIANVLSPTKGSCIWHDGSAKLDHDGVRIRLGFVAPYLELYDELTAVEHVRFIADLKGLFIGDEMAMDLLDGFGLDSSIARSDRHLRAYSSGMKQRVRCAMAFACSPSALLLDEPTSNLDEAGTAIVLEQAQAAARNGAIVFIATNDARERAIAHREIRIEPL
ncbi:MAG TPA: ABC transporter ATP-binding protein [Candidatus Kapabacteria bacterium]|nr:ABC transporter ATP-binding protein [Candidatus Kapabacteria bacterium]